MKMMSLFDGSGGFPLAASLCGIEPVYASEVEPYPIAVTRSRFPDMIHLGDVSKIFGWNLNPVDVITFGSPCQDMSIAGKRAGIKHEENGDEEITRSGLFMEAARIIQEMKEATNGLYPTFAVWENVPGAFSSNKGEDFRLVLQTLVKIVEPEADVPGVPKGGWAYADCWMGPEWSIAYRTFDAQYWGVSQRRRRIYLVLDLRGRRAGKVLFERKGLRGHFAAGRTPWKGTAADAPSGAGVCDKAECAGIIRLDNENSSPYVGCKVSQTLSTGTGHGGAANVGVCVPVILDDQGGWQITVRDDGISSTLRAEMHGNPPCVVSAGFKAGQGAQARGIGWEMEKTPTLAAEAGGNSVPSVCVKEALPFDTTQVTSPQNRSNPKWGDPCHPLAATGHPPTVVCMANGQANAELCENCAPCLNCNHEQPIVFDKEVYNSGINATGGHYIAEGGPAPTLRVDGHPPGVCVRYIVRRLTPTEFARLQGFPDRWGDIDPLDISDEQEVDRWRYIYKNYCIINGLKVSASILSKPERLKKWHDKLRTDSAEYKMWGNGIALPNALYVMQGIEEVMNHA